MPPSRTLHIKTYGCQMNAYDSERMAGVLAPLGYRASESWEDADMVILNTCHIREKAEEKVYSDLGRIREAKQRKAQRGGRMLIAVGGCVGQAEGEEIIARAPYVDMVFGPQSYHELPEMVAKSLRGERGVLALEFPEVSKFDLLPEAPAPGGASAFLAVQEGCDKFCTFCVVPYTRGAEYSRGMKEIENEAKRLVDQGVVEITLLGQNVNAYHGADEQGNAASLASLIARLANLNGLERIRYTTSHPRDMKDDLIALHGSEPKLMPHLHLPVQSGSDRILKRMNRKHTAAEYLEIVEKLRASRPDIALSSDFIVGFPGETEADFEATLRLVETVEFAQAYSFKYSPRPGTPASAEEGQVEEGVKLERLHRLQALLARQQEAFNRAAVGKKTMVLLEKDGKHPGQCLGKNPYMQSVHIHGAAHLKNALVEVSVTEAFANSLRGVILSEAKEPARAAISGDMNYIAPEALNAGSFGLKPSG